MIEVETILIFLMMFMFYVCYQYPNNTPMLIVNMFGIIIFSLANWSEIHEMFGVVCILTSIVLNSMLLMKLRVEK